jgi:hypothetical protein
MKTRDIAFYGAILVSSLGVLLAQACSATASGSNFDEDDEGGGGQGQGGGSSGMPAGVGGSLFGDAGLGGGQSCGSPCSPDFHQVVDCNGNVIQTCSGDQACDSSKGTCANACDAAVNNKQSVGCEYYATFMDQFNPDACFAVFVANTWNTPAHITVEYDGQSLPLASFARIPSGSGPSLTYQPFDPAAGIAPGDLAVLFLSGPQGTPGNGSAPCPINSAVPSGVLMYGTTGIGRSFRVASDVPVVTYEINPYGGGSAAVTGASLLLPTSAWDTNYIAVNASPYDVASPSMNIVAMTDNTTVTMVPVASVQGGGGIPGGAANTPMSFTLNRGQHAQISQTEELTGSVIQSDKPIGFMAGQQCMRAPFGVSYCDHGEQMIPPVKALGSEYVGVQYRPRKGEPGIWRVVGAVDNTLLTWSEDVGGPTALKAGEAVQFITANPFVVKSQDKDHPFMLFAYMSGSTWQQDMEGYGDADFVISVPPEQYMSQYVFFADPTYPETNLVVVRSKGPNGFQDVELDCLGKIEGWQPVGDYEWARVDLITGNFQNVGACSTGRREMKSAGRFGLWVWGWGTPLTGGVFTSNVSYGYPGGMNVQPINTVVIPPVPN